MKALGEHIRKDPKTRTNTLMKLHVRMASIAGRRRTLSPRV